ncbi:MAG: pilus assembly protein TadG-related protein, partial [Acidimicrobiia bacterium]
MTDRWPALLARAPDQPHETSTERPRLADDRGAALPLIAGAMFFLLGVAAFGVDLGWLYVNSLRIQRTADAAALAGVIHMPSFFTVAEQTAWDIAGDNGYPSGVTVTAVTGEPHQLHVRVVDNVGTFFLRVFGMDNVTIARESVAEYVLPLQLGSPDNSFGLGYLPGGDEFWAAIQGPYTKKEHGDPFATRCVLSFNDNNCGSGGTSNNEYRSRGYYYGIEIPLG